jgi:hypothetical protein
MYQQFSPKPINMRSLNKKWLILKDTNFKLDLIFVIYLNLFMLVILSNVCSSKKFQTQIRGWREAKDQYITMRLSFERSKKWTEAIFVWLFFLFLQRSLFTSSGCAWKLPVSLMHLWWTPNGLFLILRRRFSRQILSKISSRQKGGRKSTDIFLAEDFASKTKANSCSFFEIERKKTNGLQLMQCWNESLRVRYFAKTGAKTNFTLISSTDFWMLFFWKSLTHSFWIFNKIFSRNSSRNLCEKWRKQ